jgi:hypothetical protein
MARPLIRAAGLVLMFSGHRWNRGTLLRVYTGYAVFKSVGEAYKYIT